LLPVFSLFFERVDLMSDEDLASTAVDAQRAKLQALISSKKKSGGVNLHEAKQFTDAWVAYAKVVGVNDETIKVLFDGFQFAAAEPLYRYVADTRDASAYQSFIAAKSTRANEQGVALKVLINLLVLELVAPTFDESSMMWLANPRHA
jgi:hypothetical protein